MSAPFSVREVAAWSGGDIEQGRPEQTLDAASIDTRTLTPGSLFVAIRGPKYDGHAFLARACEAGAAALVVEPSRDRTAIPADVAVVEVDDTTRALADIAAGHRAGFTGPLIGLTGSSGKTTTKEMCAAILGRVAPCLATRGNLNNEYGVPLTLLQREPEHAAAVIEMGMNHRGEIARLAEIAKPTIGLVTNIGSAHIEFLGSIEEIALEKGDLYAALPPSGVACANLDDERVAEQAKRAPCPVLGFGLNSAAPIHAGAARFVGDGRYAFEIGTPEGERQVEVRGLSQTTVINALAATAVSLAAGRTLDDVADGLADYRPIRGRMTPVPLSSGATVIDDTYNANPQSMRAALESLRNLATRGRAFAVLGDMGELGEASDAAHREVGAVAARLGLDFVFAAGAQSGLVCEGAIGAGMAGDRAVPCGSHEEAAERASALLREGDWVLVKGSRAAQMERVVAALEAQEKT